jgi:membrane dipeptidase
VRQQAATLPSDSARARLFREAEATLPKATIADVADHIEHVRKVAGVDHVGLGGDYDGTDQLPVGLQDVSRYPYLFAELIRRGWSDADLAKLANGNILRALRQAEQVAARLQKERTPSVTSIGQ